MDGDEREIFNFLKTRGTDFTNAAEVCRRAGTKKMFYEDPNWAKPILLRMEERGIVENDFHGSYRIKPIPKKKRDQQWVAPNIAEILKESGVEVDSEKDGNIAEDDYYDQL